MGSKIRPRYSDSPITYMRSSRRRVTTFQAGIESSTLSGRSILKPNPFVPKPGTDEHGRNRIDWTCFPYLGNSSNTFWTLLFRCGFHGLWIFRIEVSLQEKMPCITCLNYVLTQVIASIPHSPDRTRSLTGIAQPDRRIRERHRLRWARANSRTYNQPHVNRMGLFYLTYL